VLEPNNGLLHLGFLFFSAKEDEFRIALSRAAFCLDESFHIQYLIDGDNQVTRRDIKAFLDDRGRNQNVDFVVFEVLNILH
jgi:hypothetical protein